MYYTCGGYVQTMRVLGIISEYNPFHNGHLHHINQAKKNSGCDFIIAVMSGNYVQRGEPSIVDKFIRTKTALKNGIDLVIELPVYFSTSSAENFSYGAIKSLYSTGIIDAISFGCECNDVNILNKIASTKNNFDIKKEMSNGYSYPLAFYNFIEKKLPGYEKHLSANNLLAIEYLSALKKIGWQPQIYPVKRKASLHNENILQNKISSAFSIRSAIKNGRDISKYIPENCRRISFENYADIDNASNIFHYLVARGQLTHNISDANEGIENRIIAASYNNFLISKIIEAANSKRYTNSKIRRIILHTILNMKKGDYTNKPEYLRVLGFKKQSSILLKLVQQNSLLPMITNLKKTSHTKQNSMLQKEIESSDIYLNFLQTNKFFYKNFEYGQPLIIT